MLTLERGYWPCHRLRNIRLALFCQRCSPRVPIFKRGIHASRQWFQLPSGAELVTILAEHVSDRNPYGVWAPVLVVWHAKGDPDFGVFRAAGERGGEGIRIGDASCKVGAYVPLVI